MSYTKGPWVRTPEDHHGYQSAGGSIDGPNGEIVAMGCWHNDSTAGLEIDNPADEALLLAAPALLEAAQQVLRPEIAIFLARAAPTALSALAAAVAEAIGEDAK